MTINNTLIGYLKNELALYLIHITHFNRLILLRSVIAVTLPYSRTFCTTVMRIY